MNEYVSFFHRRRFLNSGRGQVVGVKDAVETVTFVLEDNLLAPEGGNHYSIFIESSRKKQKIFK